MTVASDDALKEEVAGHLADAVVFNHQARWADALVAARQATRGLGLLVRRERLRRRAAATGREGAHA